MTPGTQDAAPRSRTIWAAQTTLLWLALCFLMVAGGATAYRLADKPPLVLNGKNVGPKDWRAAFSLLDPSGRRRTPGDFPGKALLVAFGYTRCPDACPTTLARLARVRQLLGADASRLQVIFITIDPERDTPELLGNYMQAFDPTFVALRGNDAETDAAAHAFHADYSLVQHGNDVLVEHTVDTYLVDSGGRIRDVLGYYLTADEVAQDVRAVLAAAG